MRIRTFKVDSRPVKFQTKVFLLRGEMRNRKSGKMEFFSCFFMDPPVGRSPGAQAIDELMSTLGSNEEIR